MTRAELLAAFPRPWRTDPDYVGVVLCADGTEAFTVDALGERDNDAVAAMAEMLVALVNGVEG